MALCRKIMPSCFSLLMAKGFQWRSMCARSVHSVMSDSLQSYGPYPARISCPWDSPGKNTGVGYHFLLQRIFLTQGSNPHLLLLHCRWILYPLRHLRSPFNEGEFPLFVHFTNHLLLKNDLLCVRHPYFSFTSALLVFQIPGWFPVWKWGFYCFYTSYVISV